MSQRIITLFPVIRRYIILFLINWIRPAWVTYYHKTDKAFVALILITTWEMQCKSILVQIWKDWDSPCKIFLTTGTFFYKIILIYYTVLCALHSRIFSDLLYISLFLFANAHLRNKCSTLNVIHDNATT